MPPADVVLDTDIASRFQKGPAPAWAIPHLLGARTWLTFVTVGELTKWMEVRRWGARRRGELDRWIAARPVLPYDRRIARAWGELAAAAQHRGRPRPQNDTWIAACCIHHGIPLMTGNAKDFRDFADHDGLLLLTDPAHPNA